MNTWVVKMTEQDAMCPDCGTILKGSREPGDEDHCAKSGEDVVLVEPDESDYMTEEEWEKIKPRKRYKDE